MGKGNIPWKDGEVAKKKPLPNGSGFNKDLNQT
jgi:hypothetical protein